MSEIKNDIIKISVIIPIFNREKYIEKCLENVCMQTLKEIEIICVDDCSTDRTMSVLKKCRINDKRIKIISMKKNSGSGPARNAGMKKAKGEFIAFMDSDDFYPSDDVLETLYTTAINKGVDICGGNVRIVNEKGYKVKTYIKDAQKQFRKEGYIDIYKWQWCFGYWRFIYNRKMLIENGDKFKDYRRFQDPPFMLKTMLDSNNIYGINKDVYCYRVSHKQVKYNIRSMTDKFKAINEVKEMCETYELYELKNMVIRLTREYRNKLLRTIPQIFVSTISYEFKSRRYFK